jgi:hypothetical protein
VAAAAVLLAVGIIAVAALGGFGGAGSGSPSSSGPRAGAGGPSSSSPATDPSARQAQAMRRFLGTYMSTVTSNRPAAWAMLTKPYQAASGGYGSYDGFWSTIRTATPSNVTADPTAMTVSYDVAYVKADGQRTTEHHTLQLVKNGSSYLINDQLS